MESVNLTRTLARNHHAKNYKVCLVVDFYREYVISARSSDEAIELAEARLKQRHSSMSQRGFVIGDVEIVQVTEHE
jgi:hypothetical protein